MQMLIFVLNNVDMLEDILAQFTNLGIKGATIIDSTGMARVLYDSDHKDLPLFGSLKMLLNENRPYNKTIFTVIKDDQLEIAVGAIKKVVGDLSKADVGILFSVPIGYSEGILK